MSERLNITTPNSSPGSLWSQHPAASFQQRKAASSSASPRGLLPSTHRSFQFESFLSCIQPVKESSRVAGNPVVPAEPRNSWDGSVSVVGAGIPWDGSLFTEDAGEPGDGSVSADEGSVAPQDTCNSGEVSMSPNGNGNSGTWLASSGEKEKPGASPGPSCSHLFFFTLSVAVAVSSEMKTSILKLETIFNNPNYIFFVSEI